MTLPAKYQFKAQSKPKATTKKKSVKKEAPTEAD